MTELDGQLRRAETLERDVAQAVGAYTEARSTLARLRREREGAEASGAEGFQDRVAAAERRLEAAAGRVTALVDEAGHLAGELERTAHELEASAREIRAGLPAGELGERGRPIPEVIQRDADRARTAATRLRDLLEELRRA